MERILESVAIRNITGENFSPQEIIKITPDHYSNMQYELFISKFENGGKNSSYVIKITGTIPGYKTFSSVTAELILNKLGEFKLNILA